MSVVQAMMEAVGVVLAIGAVGVIVIVALVLIYWKREFRAHFEKLSLQGVANDQLAARRALRRTNAGPAGRAPVEDNRSSLVIHRRILGQ